MTEKEQVIQALKATLISVKGALTLNQCNRDYHELQGEWIPYKKLGYTSLEHLFRDVPGFKITFSKGDWYVDAVATQDTQHIASMVAKQKTTQKKFRSNYVNRFPKRQGSWRKPAPTPNFSYNNQYSNQYYRVKSTPFNNNNHNYRYNKQSAHLNRSSDSKSSTHVKSVDQPDRSAANGSTSYNSCQVLRETNLNEQKHSIKIDKETEGSSGKLSASQRLSNLRDRLNTVDLIPLQLPAHADYLEPNVLESPVVPATGSAVYAAASALEPPPESSSSIVKLEWTCHKLGLPQPVYKTIREKIGLLCIIKVGTYSASSYPDLVPSDEGQAKEFVAGKILAQIGSSGAAGLVTSSDAQALAGLSALVAEHQAGLWANMAPHLYREKYGENLPSYWLQLIENCPSVVKDRVVNGLSVLIPNNGETKTPVNKVEPVVIDDTIDSDLPPLQFPENDYWNVFITIANSSLEIWLRIIGPQYSGAAEALDEEMISYYQRAGTTVDKSMIIKNAWYAVCLEDGEWQRAKVLEVEEETATVFLGDHGDIDTVPIDQIKILEPQFRKLPAQAILCRLEGVEELAASEAGTALVQRRLLGAALVAAPGLRDDPADPSVAVELFDTSTMVDINVNKELVQDFCLSGDFQLTQKPCSVEVGCVTEEGRVWVSRAEGVEAVRAALALLTDGPHRRALPPAPRAPPALSKGLYIVRTLAGDWVRCTVISGLDGEGTVRTLLVDSGLILRAPLSSLVPLNVFSPALNAYPPQAQQVRLSGVERVAGGMVARLRELLIGARVLCRAAPDSRQHASAPAPAPVELFVRSGPLNILASVNNAILLEYEYQQPAKPNEEEKENDTTKQLEALHKKKERIFRTAAAGAEEVPEVADKPGVLPPQTLPTAGQCFDVNVAMAANPWNFVVQPNFSRTSLQTMMASLQTECPKIPISEAPTKPAYGELYTAYYEKDDSWYRVTIAGSVSDELVSVYFCDFGDLALFERTALRPVPAAAPLARSLPPQAIRARLYGDCSFDCLVGPAVSPRRLALFERTALRPVPAAAPLARSLPPQAIRARLYDVKPLHQDWQVEDCIRFQELCVEQQFVGICKEVAKDPLNPTEPLLTLDLVDTSTEEDLYINKQLVKEGRARLASAS
ncbi:tudor domain-containing protein 7B [Bicyclus anynana]|uniref:Tudor domain-containing protein 7B n=1 Tax=Bicyclus anynana TaxID=110368 RepID=A0ABM3LYC8_BICAN|nr:tudor domain-containing protein 7B [Bicyclus anynana]